MVFVYPGVTFVKVYLIARDSLPSAVRAHGYRLDPALRPPPLLPPTWPTNSHPTRPTPTSTRLPAPSPRRNRPLLPARLNIVILFVGSRGDLQPSVAMVRRPQEEHGHRGSHSVSPAQPRLPHSRAPGVGFYSIGGCGIKRMTGRMLLPRDELEKEVSLMEGEGGEFGEIGERTWYW